MGKTTGSTGSANDYLKIIYNATAIANIADNAATSPLTNLYVGLHTADPTSTGTQTSNEISYTGYARVAVLRSSSGFTITNNAAALANTISFGQMTAGTGGTATYFTVGTASSGTGKIIHSGTLSPSIVVANGVTPQISSGTIVTET